MQSEDSLCKSSTLGALASRSLLHKKCIMSPGQELGSEALARRAALQVGPKFQGHGEIFAFSLELSCQCRHMNHRQKLRLNEVSSGDLLPKLKQVKRRADPELRLKNHTAKPATIDR